MNKKIVIAIISILSVGLAVLLFLHLRQRSEMTELVEQMQFEKEQLEEEYEDLAIQFDGYQNLDIKNDSLQDLLSKEQKRVQDLLEELRITKATSARRIAELKKELATVRAVMVTYVHQIDSLNATNARLTEENRTYREQYQVVTREAKQLEQEKTQLTEVVTRAAMLEITSFTMATLNKRDHKTRVVSQIAKLQFDITIDKNRTCEPGLKLLYLRIINPQGELLTKSENHVFTFEDEQLGYSVRHEFEYAGEAITRTLYWSLTDEPMQGVYNADVFVDGQLIGSYPFEIKK